MFLFISVIVMILHESVCDLTSYILFYSYFVGRHCLEKVLPWLCLCK